MFNLGDVLLRLVLGDSAQFRQQVAKEAGAAGDLGGKTMGQRLSGALKTGFGAIGGGLLVSATESASKFEDQLRTIQTVAPNLNLDKAKDDILALSRETGKSTDDLTAGFYDLVSAGVDVGDAIGVLRDSAKFATGALGSTAESVDLVTSVLNAYNLKASESTRVTDVFAKAVADGKVTAAELGGSIAQIAPIAASAGITIEEVSAGFAALTAKGVPAAQAATQMRAAIAALLTPNAELNRLQEQTGINFAELAKAKGLAVALDQLRKATNGNNDSFARALGSIEAYNFSLATTGENAQGFADEIIAVTGAQGLAADQYNIKSQSAVEQGKRLVAQIQSFLITVGSPFVNTLGPAIFAVNQLGQAFGLQGIAAKALGAVIGGLSTRVIGPFTTFMKTVALGGAAVFASIMDSRIVGAVTDALTKAAASGPIQAAIQTLGKILSSRLALGIGTIAVPIAIVLVGGEIAQGVQNKNEQDLKDSLAAALKTGTSEAFKEAEEHLTALERQARAGHNDSWLNIVLGQKSEFQAAVRERAADVKDAGQFIAGVGVGEAQKIGKVTAGGFATAAVEEFQAQAPALKITQAFGSDLAAQSGTQKAYGARIAAAAAQGIVDKVTQARSVVDQAWQALVLGLKNAQTPTQERARLIGYLASKELAKGLHSGDPAVRAQAQVTKQAILDRLAALKPNAKNIGKDGMEELRKAMKSKDNDIAAAARAIYTAAITPISKLPAAGKIDGSNFIKNVIYGMNSQQNALKTAAAGLAGIARDHFQLSSPAKVGPWSERGGPEGWGKRFGEFVANGIRAGVHSMARASTTLAGAALPVVPPAYGGMLNYQAPRSSYPSSGIGAMDRVATGKGDTNIHVEIEGLLKAKDPFDVARTLGRFARAGVFNPDPEPKRV